jgi:glutamate dehydrogenase (NAD(P)+)
MRNDLSGDFLAHACLPSYEPKSVDIFDLPSGRCFFVTDKTILGRSWGGIRIANDLTVDEMRILARSMTVKSILAGIPIGGAKAGVYVTKNYDKSTLINSLSKVLGPYIKSGSHFLGTDIGFTEDDANALYALAGTKRNLFSSRISVGETCAYGILSCIEFIRKITSRDLEGGTVALEGFGRLGSATANLLSSKGFKIVAVSNIGGALYDSSGLDIDELITLSNQDPTKMFQSYLQRHGNSVLYPKEKINLLQCDILIPGARIFSIDTLEAEEIKAKIVCPLSNAPVTLGGEKMLAKRGIISVPDVISNSGGVIGSVVQHLGALCTQRLISETIQKNLGLVYNNLQWGEIPKELASAIALKRLQDLERHQRTGSMKLVLSWVKRIGPNALLRAIEEYLSLAANKN